MTISGRSYDKEWIDQGFDHYTLEEYDDCLIQLDRFGRYFGGDKTTLDGFKLLQRPPTSILDVGCGGGLFTIRLAEKYPSSKIIGIDTAPEAINVADRNLINNSIKLKNIEFIVPQTPHLSYPIKSFDVITSTLVCHHLNDEELISFLKSAYEIAEQAIIINDLHRNFWATIGFSVVTPLFFKNRIFFHDGLISIKRGFVYKDWVTYLSAAGIPLSKCTIVWHWAFRWLVFIDAKKQ